jgi:hypothetical protein
MVPRIISGPEEWRRIFLYKNQIEKLEHWGMSS